MLDRGNGLILCEIHSQGYDPVNSCSVHFNFAGNERVFTFILESCLCNLILVCQRQGMYVAFISLPSSLPDPLLSYDLMEVLFIFQTLEECQLWNKGQWRYNHIVKLQRVM